MLEKNPTLEELNHLYESEQYKNLLKEFANRLSRDIVDIVKLENDKHNLFFKLLYCQRRYMALNEDFANVVEVIENNRAQFLEYQVAVTEHFNEQEIDTTYLIEKFCEFYLLHTGNIKRLYNYLMAVHSNTSNTHKTSNIPRIYQDVITNLYYKTLEK